MENDTKEVLAAAKKTNGLRAKIRKDLGLNKLAEGIVDDDIYEFTYKKDNLESSAWILLHGKCIGKGQQQLASWGYSFLQSAHISKKDASKCRVTCMECGLELDGEKSKKLVLERDKKLSTAHQDYLVEKQLRAEWEAEQILLGKK